MVTLQAVVAGTPTGPVVPAIAPTAADHELAGDLEDVPHWHPGCPREPLPLPPLVRRPPPRLGVIRWPCWGLTRYAAGHLLVSATALRTLVPTYSFSGQVNVTLDDGVTSPPTVLTMWLVAARPLSDPRAVATSAPPASGDRESAYVLTLADSRWAMGAGYWNSVGDSLFSGGTPTWGGLIAQFAYGPVGAVTLDAAATELLLTAYSPDYPAPTAEVFGGATRWRPAAPLADAVAAGVNLRLAVTAAGAATAQNAASALAAWEAWAAVYLSRMEAGGLVYQFTRPDLGSGTVTLPFEHPGITGFATVAGADANPVTGGTPLGLGSKYLAAELLSANSVQTEGDLALRFFDDFMRWSQATTPCGSGWGYPPLPESAVPFCVSYHTAEGRFSIDGPPVGHPYPLLSGGYTAQSLSLSGSTLTSRLNGRAATASLSGLPPGGAAGGSLAGTYPNPSIAASVALTGTPTAPTAAGGTSTTQIATTAFVAGETATKAPLASPALTGTPTAPTASGGTSTTQVATTAFVMTEVGVKANTASPTLTGTPAAPTATAGTNTTQIATTAFVTAAVSTAGGTYQPLDSDLTSWALVTRASGFDTFAATPTSANLRALLTDEVGTGAAYFVGGALGTPVSGTATNLTGLPINTGVSGLGTGVATFLGTPSSANLLSAMTDRTGSGGFLVFSLSPTLTTPNIGVATATSVNGIAFAGFSSPSLSVSGTAVISGTNSGDQTITLTGDVTGSGTGAFATTIGANKVTNAMLRQSAGLSVPGRSANSTGNVADITGATVGHVLQVLTGPTLGFGYPALTSQVKTATANPFNVGALSNNTYGDVTGATITLPGAGEYRVSFGALGVLTTSLSGSSMDLLLVLNGSGTVAVRVGYARTGGVPDQTPGDKSYVITATGSHVLKLQARRDTNGTVTTAELYDVYLTATRIV